ncbi:MAG TPA: hypothetical protein VG028_20725 [Terriglobia bacterium]|nr:hypothetical protein [Terriglobia bacterium]
MRTARSYFVLILLTFLCAAFSPNLRADEWDKKTTITFSGPVDVSGHRLEAGTYVFKLADTIDRHVVQIFSPDERHVYATILAMPDWRLTPSDKTVVKFSETADNVTTTERDLPESGIPIKEWFYPGDNFGQEFRVKPAPLVAEAEATPLPPTSEVAPPSPPPAPEEKAEEQPEATPEAPAAVAPAQEPVAPAAPQAQSTEPAPVAPAETPAELPQTASLLPLIGLIGVMSLGVGISLREILKHSA